MFRDMSPPDGATTLTLALRQRTFPSTKKGQTMPQTRTEQDTKRRIDELAPRFQRLNSDRLRVESSIELLAKDLEAAEAAAMEVFGTTDLVEIEKKLDEARQNASAEVDAFESVIVEIEDKLRALSKEQ